MMKFEAEDDAPDRTPESCERRVALRSIVSLQPGGPPPDDPDDSAVLCEREDELK